MPTKTVREWLREYVERDLHIHEPVKQTVPSLRALRESEWNRDFETLMRNRLIMGAFRYGLLRDKDKSDYSRMTGIIRYVDAYRRTGNIECMVDIANYALLEFTESKHPNRHFIATDDGFHVQRKA